MKEMKQTTTLLGIGASAGDDLGVATTALLDGAFLSLEIDVNDAESFFLAGRPLEIVEQRPDEIALDRRARLDRGGDGFDV